MSSLQKFNQTLDDLSQEVGRLNAAASAYTKMEQLAKTADNTIAQLAASNKRLEEISARQKEQQERFGKSMSELFTILEEKTERIMDENKTFYKDFEGTVRIKLDEHRSQIRQHIEGERNHVRQMFEMEFGNHSAQLHQIFKDELAAQTERLIQGQKSIKLSILIAGCLTVLFAALVVFKLWSP